MTKYKILKYMVLLIMLIPVVNALNTCRIVEGSGTISSEVWYNQTFDGQVIQNTSVNITVDSGSGWLNISCVTTKPYGQFQNLTNGSIYHNITFCNNAIAIPHDYNTWAYIINSTSSATECNTTFAIRMNSTNNIIVEIYPNANRINTTGYPLIYIGSSAIVAGAIAYLWMKRRS